MARDRERAPAAAQQPIAYPAKGQSPQQQQTEEQILLRGTELGYAWTVVLDVTTVSMASSLANREGVFVLFGACTVP